MGTTFVTLSSESSEGVGFWMHDSVLELWLRLLALHLPEPTSNGDHQATIEVRNAWLLASTGYFGGSVPHDLQRACATPEGCDVVRRAIASLLKALTGSAPLEPGTLNLLEICGEWTQPIERSWLREIGLAFIDLLDGKITGTAASTEVMPGSKPYPAAGGTSR